MGDFELSDKQKDEFLNLPVIRDNFVNCWFEDQKLIMPSGQGKTLKGVVLASLEVFKIQQAKIDELQKRINKIAIMVHNETGDYYLDEKIQEILR